MDKTIGKDIQNPLARQAFLKDNCDTVEEKGYMKPFTPEQLQGHKEKLANVSIEISDIEMEQKEANAEYKSRLKPLKESREEMVGNIKAKSKYVKEVCYKFVDQNEKTTGYYNGEGDLIESRPATADEMQPSLFAPMRKTGTDDNDNN